MKGFATVLLILAAVLVDANGARIINGDEVVEPQNFGSIPGGFPETPGLGSFPSPLFGGSFPGTPGFFPASPGFGSPVFGGSIPVSPVTFPASPGLGFGPSTFCSFPGVLCSPAQPDNPAGSNVGGVRLHGSP